MESSLVDYLRVYYNDQYRMEVLYYAFKNVLLKNSFNLQKIKISINPKYHGCTIKISHGGLFNNPMNSMLALLSLRAISLDESYISLCKDYTLLFRADASLLKHAKIIASCLNDSEFSLIYGLAVSFYDNNGWTQDEKDSYKESIVKPEYRCIREYYENVASGKESITSEVIPNLAHICDDSLIRYYIPKEVKYIGNTAFSYCDNLTTLVFQSDDISFGRFPFFECTNLSTIIVPDSSVDYYQKELPIYSRLIKSNADQSSYQEKHPPHVDSMLTQSEPIFSNDSESPRAGDIQSLFEEGEASIGDKIIYESRLCIVRDKMFFLDTPMLLVKYENGDLKTVANDSRRYEVVGDKLEANSGL